MKNKQFRISAKNILLTYSQVNTEITPQYILEYLNNKINLYPFDYVIAKELHQNNGTHYHVILIKKTKFDIKRQDVLDITYQDQVYHGSYTPVKSIRDVITYVCKHKDYVTNLSNLYEGQLLTPKQFIRQQVQEKGVEQALLDHYSNSTDKAIAGMSISSLKKHFNDLQKLEQNLRLDKIDTPFKLEHFDIPDPLQNWLKKPALTLLLVGDSGLGKTQFSKAFAKHTGLKTLLVSHKQDFRRLDSSYDIIIIDDANIHEFEETQLLSLIDNQTDKTLRVLYDSVVRKAGMIQIIAMNKPEYAKIASLLMQPRFARRILFQSPQKPFILNVNIQINNNYITNNYINNYNSPQNSCIDMQTPQQQQQNTTDMQTLQQQEQILVQENIQRMKQALIS